MSEGAGSYPHSSHLIRCLIYKFYLFLQYLKVQQALTTLTDSSFSFHNKGLNIVEAQKELMNIFLSTNSHCFTKEQLDSGKNDTLHSLQRGSTKWNKKNSAYPPLVVIFISTNLKTHKNLNEILEPIIGLVDWNMSIHPFLNKNSHLI